MDIEFGEAFLQRRDTNSQWACEKRLNVTHHYGNKQHNGTSLTYWNGYYEKTDRQRDGYSGGGNVEKSEGLCSAGVGGNVATAENCRVILKKLKIELAYGPAAPVLGVCPK